MTVKELRELLGTVDQDLEVAVVDDGMMQFVYTIKVETDLWEATPNKPVLIIW